MLVLTDELRHFEVQVALGHSDTRVLAGADGSLKSNLPEALAATGMRGKKLEVVQMETARRRAGGGSRRTRKEHIKFSKNMLPNLWFRNGTH